MKISVISDLHFGLSPSAEMEMDSFDNAEEAIEKSLGSDLVIICGDIFDSRVPKTQSWANALRVLSKPLLVDNEGTRLVSCTKGLKEITERRTLRHLPVVALHGNHERRARDDSNTLQALENAGLLVYLNLDTIVFEKDGVKVAIHGMSNVPETYAKDVLGRWDPKPLPGCFNILILHQSIEPYVFSPLEPPTISISNLPKGFDLIIDGHIHEHIEETAGQTRFIIPGSTVITQMDRSEAGSGKGMYEITLGEKLDARFMPLERARKFFYEDVRLGPDSTDVRRHIVARIDKMLQGPVAAKKPIVKFRLVGRETDIVGRELAEIIKKYEDSAIVVFSKKLEREGVDSKFELLNKLVEQKMSVEEIGMSMLDRNLESSGFKKSFDAERLFCLLSEGGVDTAMGILLGEQATLKGE